MAIITIDGPAGAGKSTIAKIVAQRLGYQYLDTGAMFRAVAMAVKEADIDPEDEEAIKDLLPHLSIEPRGEQIILNGKDISRAIRTPEMDILASRISRLKTVRLFLMRLQRLISQGKDIVCEGRDMGTVVFPKADCKFFLTASYEERAKRRKKQLEMQGKNVLYETILFQIKKRDEADATRAIAPMTKAEDAVLVDTTGKDIEEVTKTILRSIDVAMTKKSTKDSGKTQKRFSIDECLGFIANRLVRAFQKAFDKKLEAHELTSAQFCVLAKLLEEEGMTQTELAHRLFIESPTLVRTLDRMEEAGLIERRRDPKDRRAYHIHLKPKGRKMQDLVDEIGFAVHKEATKDIPKADMEKLRKSLLKIWENLENL